MNDMTVIGKRKRGICAVYCFCLLASLAMIAFGIFGELNGERPTISIILGALCAVICFFVIMDYLATPLNAIEYDGQDTIYVGGQAVSLFDIKDVSYKRAKVRGIQYSYGTITVTTKSEDIAVVSYVADCEEVSKTLTQLVYEKNSDVE